MRKNLAFLCFCFSVSLLFSSFAQAATVAERLGYKPTDRLLIVNNDDAGMCHSANLATIEGQEKGLITTATIMMPCPWSLEIIEYAKAHPEKDFGVHLTHTSEWKHYRWGTVAPQEKVKGLLDENGYMHRGVEAVYKNAPAKEALIEGRAQIQRALDLGVPVTHIDSHMGTMQENPKYHEAYIQLAAEFNLPLRMASQSTYDALGFPEGRKLAAAQGLIFPDYFVYEEFKDYKKMEPKEFWTKIIKNLKPGITELYIHATVLGDESRSITYSSETRGKEYECFVKDPDIRKLIEDEGIIMIGYRPLLELQRKEKK